MSDENSLFTAIKKLGFEVISHERDGINGMLKIVQTPSTPPIEKVVSLLKMITKKYELTFFDYYHPQYSDPGAYCSAVVIDENTVSYMEGNHGWTSKWKEVFIEDFAIFMQKNWDKDDGSGQFSYCIHLRDNKWGNPR